MAIAAPDRAPLAVAVAERIGVAIVDLVADAGTPAGSFCLAPRAGGAAPAVAGGYSQPGDTAMVLQTSGTTSRPKIVPLSVANLCASAHDAASQIPRSAFLALELRPS